MDLQKFRKTQLRSLTNEIGVYALCDLDEIPIYVGQSTDGIRTRVNRHLTSARSDVIANRQLDVWEVAYVWAWPMPQKSKIDISNVEAQLIQVFHPQKPLMNGTLPPVAKASALVPAKEKLQILPQEEIERRKESLVRLPRQAAHFNNLFSHILEVKNNQELRRTLSAHFSRLEAYYKTFMGDFEK